MMPGENGVQLAERISDDPDLTKTTLIMLSSADPGANQNSNARIGAYLTKPARQMQLLDTLAALQMAKLQGQPLDQLRQFAYGASAPERQAETALSGLRVLLVEDNRVNRELVRENLTKLNCEVTTAEHGKEAVALVTEQAFDVILMDCQMPVMDGFEATRTISAMIADNEMPSTPIIALTANAMQGDRERCLEAGMDDYATKPIRKKILIEILTRWCAVKENQAALVTPIEVGKSEIIGSVEGLGEATGSPDEVLASSSAAIETPAFDVGAEVSPIAAAIDQEILAATQEAMGDQFKVILEYYLEDATQYLEQIGAGMASEDAKAVVTAAHPLKSSSREIGVCGLADIAKEIEEKARAALDSNTDLTSITPLVGQLQSSFAEAKSELEAVIAQGGSVHAWDTVA